MNNILVAIDMAREGGNDEVLKTAQIIAKVTGGSITVLHAIEPAQGFVVAMIPKEMLLDRKSKAETELAELAARYDISKTVVLEGAPATEILEYAETIAANLIILHSRDPDMSNYFLGSVASRVIRRAHCSVHVLRHPK